MAKRTRREPVETETADARQAEARRDGKGLFPIVGIGASAGGLEALEQFFRNVPAFSGMAFVVIQHLDPTHKGIMPELLQRISKMPVSQATDRVKLQPDHVYVIPPNKDMSILRGALHLFEPTASRGLRLPIDFFLRALAEDRQEASVGVILSGMGSDGTLGLRAIKDKAGLTLVQAPASAKFDGMPRSAIDAGLADIVAPADELPGKLTASLRHSRVAPKEPDAQSQSGLEKATILIRSQTGHDFSLYKKSTLYRRIERRMGIHLIDRISDYVRFLRENPQEIELLFRELLIGVTSFFRDPEAWESLKTRAFPALLANLGNRKDLRAWVPACSTGEEAYSLAIVFKEALEPLQACHTFSLQIYATDLDANAIEIARRGVYPKNISVDVAPERLNRFLVAEEDGYRIRKEIREMVIFAPQNLISDPPFTKLDILTCRNLLIYLSPELQKKLLPLFHFSLNPGGILLLGSAETIGSFGELFTPIDGKARLYRRSHADSRLSAVQLPTSPVPSSSAATADRQVGQTFSLQSLADQVLLQRFSPAAVLTSDQGDILYINGRTGKYLEAASGKANWNIYAMAREGLRLELASAFQKARRHKGVVTVPRVKVEDARGALEVGLSVEALEQPEPLRGMVMIVFHELAEPAVGKATGARGVPGRGARAAELEREAQQLREELLTTHEEMQSSQEELKSANEELQSTNEELQSTNEELTTSKEEMQSLNEELQTVNAELQSKVDDLSRASNDMNNLLNSTEIATVFLDNALHVRRYTSPTSRIIKLIPGDIGRPLSDIATDLRYPELYADAQEVLRTLVFSEKEIPTVDGRWFTVRIMPYRTADNLIDGMVITFVDITVAKTLEGELRQASRATGN